MGLVQLDQDHIYPRVYDSYIRLILVHSSSVARMLENGVTLCLVCLYNVEIINRNQKDY